MRMNMDKIVRFAEAADNLRQALHGAQAKDDGHTVFVKRSDLHIVIEVLFNLDVQLLNRR